MAPETQAGARLLPGLGQRNTGLAQRHAVSLVVSLRVVADQRERQDSGEDPESGRGEERCVPACDLQDGEERDNADDLAELAEDTGELGEHRDSPRLEPRREQPEHCHESHGVTAAHEQTPGAERRG